MSQFQPNCHPGNKFKIEEFWFVFKSFVIQCSLIFPQKIGGGENRKEPSFDLEFAFLDHRFSAFLFMQHINLNTFFESGKRGSRSK